MTGFSKKRMATTLLPALTAAALLSGCTSSPGEDESPILPTESAEETTPASGDAEAADIAALERLFRDYNAAIAELDASPEVNMSVFDGIANDEVRETHLGRTQSLKNLGLRVEGEFTVSGLMVELGGDAARVQGCVNADAREVLDENGDVVPAEHTDSDASLVLAERAEGGWLITEDRGAEGATVTC